MKQVKEGGLNGDRSILHGMNRAAVRILLMLLGYVCACITNHCQVECTCSRPYTLQSLTCWQCAACRGEPQLPAFRFMSSQDLYAVPLVLFVPKEDIQMLPQPAQGSIMPGLVEYAILPDSGLAARVELALKCASSPAACDASHATLCVACSQLSAPAQHRNAMQRCVVMRTSIYSLYLPASCGLCIEELGCAKLRSFGMLYHVHGLLHCTMFRQQDVLSACLGF